MKKEEEMICNFQCTNRYFRSIVVGPEKQCRLRRAPLQTKHFRKIGDVTNKLTAHANPPNTTQIHNKFPCSPSQQQHDADTRNKSPRVFQCRFGRYNYREHHCDSSPSNYATNRAVTHHASSVYPGQLCCGTENMENLPNTCTQTCVRTSLHDYPLQQPHNCCHCIQRCFHRDCYRILVDKKGWTAGHSHRKLLADSSSDMKLNPKLLRYTYEISNCTGQKTISMRLIIQR